jgi:hypothetical protein
VSRLQGRLSIVDVRIANAASAQYLDAHDRKVNSIHFRNGPGQDDTCFVTSSSSGAVTVFDVRQLGMKSGKGKMITPGAEMRHAKSCHSMFPSCGCCGEAEPVVT